MGIRSIPVLLKHKHSGRKVAPSASFVFFSLLYLLRAGGGQKGPFWGPERINGELRLQDPKTAEMPTKQGRTLITYLEVRPLCNIRRYSRAVSNQNPAQTSNRYCRDTEKSWSGHKVFCPSAQPRSHHHVIGAMVSGVSGSEGTKRSNWVSRWRDWGWSHELASWLRSQMQT